MECLDSVMNSTENSALLGHLVLQVQVRSNLTEQVLLTALLQINLLSVTLSIPRLTMQTHSIWPSDVDLRQSDS